MRLYKPLVAGKRYFVAPRAYYGHTVSSFFSGSQQLAQYTENKNGFGLDLGYQFSSKAELRIGEDYQWYSEDLRIGTPIEQDFHITPWVTNMRFQYLGQDSVQVPTRGTEFRTQYNYFTQRPNSSEGFSQWISDDSALYSGQEQGNYLRDWLRWNQLWGDRPGASRIFARWSAPLERLPSGRVAG